MYFNLTKQSAHQHFKKKMQLEAYSRELIVQSHQVRKIHPRMGVKVIYEKLCPKNIGRDRFEKLLMQNGFRVLIQKNFIKTTDSQKVHFSNLIAGTQVTDINQVWVSDITYFISPLTQVYYVITIMDLYSRRILGYAGSSTMRAEATSMKALKMTLNVRRIMSYNGLIHHSDRGSQYRFNQYITLLKDYGIKVSMCDNVYDNAHQERLNGTIKNDYMRNMDCSTLKKLQNSLKVAVNSYNTDRPHSSILKMSPVDFEKHLLTLPQSERPVMNIYQHESTPNSQRKK